MTRPATSMYVTNAITVKHEQKKKSKYVHAPLILFLTLELLLFPEQQRHRRDPSKKKTISAYDNTRK